MERIMAFCGLTCQDCGAFVATQNDDDAKRVEVSQEWSRLFKVEVKPEDINCDGCLTDEGRLFSYCKVCEIRRCAKEQGLLSCAHCDSYPCQKLDFIFKTTPEAKERLDDMAGKNKR